MIERTSGALNVWDYLEVVTGYDRGTVKRIGVALTYEDLPSNIARDLDIEINAVNAVRDYLIKWYNWAEGRQK